MNKKKVVHKVRIKQKIKKSEICAPRTPQSTAWIRVELSARPHQFYVQNKHRTARIRIIMCCIYKVEFKHTVSPSANPLSFIFFLSFLMLMLVDGWVVYHRHSRRRRTYSRRGG